MLKLEVLDRKVLRTLDECPARICDKTGNLVDPISSKAMSVTHLRPKHRASRTNVGSGYGGLEEPRGSRA